MTSQSIGRICNLGENESWQGDEQAQRPHRHCDGNACPQSAIPGPSERVQNDHVAVQGHDHDEEDAAEEADGVEDFRDPANKVPKDPLANHGVVGLQWQRQGKKEVSQCQVEETNVCQVGLLPVLH